MLATRVPYDGDRPPEIRRRKVDALRCEFAEARCDVHDRQQWHFVSGSEAPERDLRPNVFRSEVGDAVVLVVHAWQQLGADPLVAGMAGAAGYESAKGILRRVLHRVRRTGPSSERIRDAAQQHQQVAAPTSLPFEPTAPSVDEALKTAAKKLPPPEGARPVFDQRVAEAQAVAAVMMCSFPEDDVTQGTAYVESRMQESETTWHVAVRSGRVKLDRLVGNFVRQPAPWRYIARVVQMESGVVAVALRREEVPPARPVPEGSDSIGTEA